MNGTIVRKPVTRATEISQPQVPERFRREVVDAFERMTRDLKLTPHVVINRLGISHQQFVRLNAEVDSRRMQAAEKRGYLCAQAYREFCLQTQRRAA